jgi:hypothetical protein
MFTNPYNTRSLLLLTLDVYPSAGSDGSFPGPTKADIFGLGRDVHERSTGDVVGDCFTYMQDVLDHQAYDRLDPNIYLMATNNPTSGGTVSLPVSDLNIVRAWFDQHFKDKKPTLEVRRILRTFSWSRHSNCGARLSNDPG